MKRFLLATVILGLIVAGIAVYILVIRPASIEAVGQGTPQITSQFSDIKTRAKTPSPISMKDSAVRYVVYVRPERNSVPAKETPTPDRFYESCIKQRDSTATPTQGS